MYDYLIFYVKNSYYANIEDYISRGDDIFETDLLSIMKHEFEWEMNFDM